MWEARASRFPEHTPNTREYYLLRSIFEEQFPSQQAMATVPKVRAPAAEFSLFICQVQQLKNDANGDSNMGSLLRCAHGLYHLMYREALLVQDI